VKERLIQQGGLDGRSTTAKKRAKRVEGNFQRLLSRPDEAVAGGRIPFPTLARFLCGLGKVDHREPTETTGIDEANLAMIVKLENGVGMLRQRLIRLAHQQAAGHAKMDKPLTVPRTLIFRFGSGTARAGVCSRQIDNNMLADAMDAFDGTAGQGVDKLGGRRTERLGLRAEPDGKDGSAAHALVDAARNGFDFRQFRHG
jgi:hypothetical protein